ncbi:MAG: YigZ family protein [Bacilli bacterium]|nr:YigZ family protein [Bacilli bacterium]
MFVPLKITEYSLIVKKSHFIAVALPFTDVNHLEDALNKIKKDYPKATHYLYAYKVKNILKGSNDQEPGNIAQSFLTLINQHQLDEILIVVVRYFGGVKLGASNLLRTYHEAVNQLIKKTPLGEKVFVNHYHFYTDYATFNKIKKLGYFIENVRYFDTIEIDIISKVDITSSLNELKVKDLKIENVERIINEH